MTNLIEPQTLIGRIKKAIGDFIQMYREKSLDQAPIGLSIARLGLCFVIWYDYYYHVLFSEAYLSTVTCYDPKGILNLFHLTMPTMAEVNGWILLKDISLIFFVFGLFTRPASIVLLICNLHLMGFFESINRDGYWCHGSNVYLLTHLAFIFAQPGKISLDYFLSKKIKNYPKLLFNEAKQFAWPIYLGQISVLLMFVNSFYWKIFNSGFAWAYSDNMRNILVLQYQMTLFKDYPEYIFKIMESEYLYKGLAFFNLLIQFSPLLCAFFIKRPIIRAILGLGFVIETLGLYYIMGLNDLEWIALYVFFVDWEYFFRISKLTVNRDVITLRAKKWIKGFCYTFIFCYFLTGFNFVLPSFCCVYNTYPFSAFPMYAENLAKAPYNEHSAFARVGLDIDIEGYGGTNSLTEKEMEYKMNYLYYPTEKFKPQEIAKSKLCESIKNYLKNENVTYSKVSVYFVYRVVDAYPASPYPRIAQRGIHAVLDSTGKGSYVSFNTFDNAGNHLSIVTGTPGFFQKVVKIEYLCDASKPAEQVMSYLIKGDTLWYDKPCGSSGLGSLFFYTDTLSKNEAEIIKNRVHVPHCDQ